MFGRVGYTCKQAVRQIIRNLYKEVLGREFPQTPYEQLMEAIKAVFRSWGNERAILYRKLNDISDDLGTAVNVQSMVFGNKGNDSGTAPPSAPAATPTLALSRSRVPPL